MNEEFIPLVVARRHENKSRTNLPLASFSPNEGFDRDFPAEFLAKVPSLMFPWKHKRRPLLVPLITTTMSIEFSRTSALVPAVGCQ